MTVIQAPELLANPCIGDTNNAVLKSLPKTGNGSLRSNIEVSSSIQPPIPKSPIESKIQRSSSSDDFDAFRA